MLDTLRSAMDRFSDSDVDFADIRHEVRQGTDMLIVNGVLRRFNKSGRSGTVARALVGECWGQASTTDEVTAENMVEILSQAARMAKASARYSRKSITLPERQAVEGEYLQSIKEDPLEVSSEDKLEAVRQLDKAQGIDDRVVNTNSLYRDGKREFYLANSMGSSIYWNEIRTYLIAQAVAKEGTRTQFDYDSKGGTAGFEMIRDIDIQEMGASVGKGAVELLSASKPPSGETTVVVDGNVAGLIAHEVCGHASEADEVVKERSFLTGMVGKRVAAEHVTMVDDGTLEGLAGSYPFDSEGTSSSRSEIINEGVYNGYLHTLETAALMDVKPTGNGRAQDYNRRIFARMSNTFFESGDWSKDEIISDTKEGLYVIRASSGMEDVVGGGVQASALKGYIIRNGELTDLVRSMTLTGQVLEILKTVDAVGDELEFSPGTCGKGEEDFIPVTSGGPHMRAKIVVGGG
ncbi:TldD/PmbA family protein [Candidatus Thorarchaeota archaeon]|nr:MAG: TldD/PmbA family protein [Candidatus Thorarchaeota archaeon]